MQRNLDRLFNPRSIAIIGASKDLGRISGQPVAHLINHGYGGAVYPVNPKYDQVAGLTCYPTVLALPEIPDLAIVVVNASLVPDMLKMCGEKGIPFAIIFSSGFAELGSGGDEAQREIQLIAEEYNIGVIGPNCQGMMNITFNVFAGFGAAFYEGNFRCGPVSLVTQSGGFGYAVVSLAQKEGLGFHQVISIGNEAGITTTEVLEYYIEDERTKVVAVYMEGLKDARPLLEIGDRALQKGKPIMVWKVGNSDIGSRAAASHTGNLGGNAVLFKSLFKQKGIIPVHDIQDLVDYEKAFRSGKRPGGKRVAIVTISGGAGILFADQCALNGLEVPPLSRTTVDRLREVVPKFASLLNPVDVTANIFNEPDLLGKALKIIISDECIDSVAILNASMRGELAVKVAREIVEVDKSTDKPIFVAWSALEEWVNGAYDILDEAMIPQYRTPVRCGDALGALSLYADAQRRLELEKSEEDLEIGSLNAVRDLLQTSGEMTEHAAKRIVEKYGIPVTREQLVTSKEAALLAAEQIGYPLAIKVQSPDIPHKTEAKVVQLGVSSAQQLSIAYDRVLKNALEFKSNAKIEGVLLQEMVDEGVEAIIGATNDPVFGPTVMFGLGGIFVEVIQDVSFRFAPVTRSLALEMIRNTRGYPILRGARGQKEMDVDALADALVRLSYLMHNLQDIVYEVDINPLFVFKQGNGVKAADALIRISKQFEDGANVNE